uniref:Uncharacterized protein n=1 Tax=Oryza glumipatula TaxID=40148 RepID=A0A0E0BMT9_9ORYZ
MRLINGKLYSQKVHTSGEDQMGACQHDKIPFVNMVVSFTSRIQRLVTQKIVLNPCMDGACQPIDVC